MSKLECIAAVQACKLFLDDYEIEQKRNKSKCARFFEIVKHIRLFLQLAEEILKRIENIENEMNEITEKIK